MTWRKTPNCQQAVRPEQYEQHKRKSPPVFTFTGSPLQRYLQAWHKDGGHQHKRLGEKYSLKLCVHRRRQEKQTTQRAMKKDHIKGRIKHTPSQPTAFACTIVAETAMTEWLLSYTKRCTTHDYENYGPFWTTPYGWLDMLHYLLTHQNGLSLF